MDQSVLKYIENEKEIAKYKISMLERREISPARKRIIEIEKEFIEISFETMNFSSIDEVTAAIDLYRQSRRLFYTKYQISNVEQYFKIFTKKVEYLKSLALELTSKRIQELNLVQDFEFYTQYLNHLSKQNNSSVEEENLISKKKNLKYLLNQEPSGLAKKRARLQALFYSMGLVILEFITRNLDKNSSDYFILNNKIDSFVFDLEKYIYKYYNQSLDDLPDKLKNTMGENSYFKKMHRLENIFSRYAHPHAHVHLCGGEKVLFDAPKIININSGHKDLIVSSYKKDFERGVKSKSLGILFPVDRLGNEKMTLMYHEIYFSGLNISELFSDIISNVKIEKNNKLTYYKAIFLKPLWALLNYAAENKEYHFFLSKLLNEELVDVNKFNDKEYIKELNCRKINPLEIDLSSQILIPPTRSEETFFEEVNSLVFKKISEVKNDFKNIN